MIGLSDMLTLFKPMESVNWTDNESFTVPIKSEGIGPIKLEIGVVPLSKFMVRFAGAVGVHFTPAVCDATVSP